MIKFTFPAVLMFTLAGCATVIPACTSGLMPVTEARLFFGDQIAGGGLVSAAQWQQFVDSEVTPRFPGGFTVLATSGQWQAPNGTIARETGHELVIVFAPAVGTSQKLDEIRTAYKQRFMQESVLLAQSSACAGF